ncbi:hypothetical protein [Sporosarcina highlanderae]|uniref:Uncharacterized protein n=1 Tax=Sporosarcina highlanderae TaxID=3035916 RepID=A0ABT8JP83_9BACL|nr:hypothetical protein [Sporosarcina highlanderae]MDN4606941.1 hypothetical protein [Sporosarcina highlanderae]
MKMRAVLLIALLIGGTYAMLESINDYNEKTFNELFESMNTEFDSLTFNKPAMNGNPAETWKINDEVEVDELLQFLQNYSVKKIKPNEVNPYDNIDELSISLKDSEGNSLTIMVAENLIIQNSNLYYEIIDGPLDVNWIVRFIVSNK